MNRKEKIVKEIIVKLKGAGEDSFYLNNLDALLEFGETLGELGNNILEVDKENPQAKTLRDALNDALSDLHDAKEKRKEAEGIQVEINNDPDMDQYTNAEKENDIKGIESNAQNMIDIAEEGYGESLKQATILEAHYRKEKVPTI